MDFSIHIDTISMGLPIEYLKGAQASNTYIIISFCPWMLFLILTNSADPDEMQHYAAFHLGLYRLPKFSFKGFQYAMG